MNRAEYLKERIQQEEAKIISRVDGVKSLWKTDFFDRIISSFRFITRLLLIENLTKYFSAKLKMKTYIHEFSELPNEFDQFTICHLSDLHIDDRPDIVPKFKELTKELDVDLLVITGDIDSHSIHNGVNQQNIGKRLKEMISHIKTKNTLLVLGNHDSSYAVREFESNGIQCLINESFEISRENSKLAIHGLDDVHYFYHTSTKQKLDMIEENQFSILLIHSCEFFEEAANKNINLYLCGHSHGGQISLPNETPLMRRVYQGKEYAKGLWKHKKMLGYTHFGLGTSGAHIRLNTPAEIVTHILKVKK